MSAVRNFCTRTCGTLFSLSLSLFFSAPAAAVDFVDQEPATEAVIGGTASIKGAQPWIAALARKTTSSPASQRQFCTGVVVDPYWVVTASHCVEETAPEKYEVIIGREDLDSGGGEVIEAAEAILVPYEYWDIALIRLKTPTNAKPIAMATTSQERTYFGRSMTVYGWGNTFYKAETSATCDVQATDSTANPALFSCKTYVFRQDSSISTLQQGNVTLQTYDACSERLKAAFAPATAPVVSERTYPEILCAWDPLEKSAPCYGDSGGPLVVMDGNTPVLVGLTNYGFLAGCLPNKEVGAYAHVSLVRSYLYNRMGGDPALGFDQLCPAKVKATVSVEPLSSVQSQIDIRWDAVEKAKGYRVFYSAAQNNGQNINSMVLGADRRSISVKVPPGASYHVKILAQGEQCDGPMSSLLTVVAP